MRVRESGLLWQDLDGEVVLLDLAESRYLRLNKSGGLLWHELLDGRPRSELVATLVQTFGISAATAEADVDRFIASLSDHGFLE